MIVWGVVVVATTFFMLWLMHSNVDSPGAVTNVTTEIEK